MTEPTRDRTRTHDLVLYGATGFTGQLVAEYLLKHYGDSDLRLALAGRSEDKLERVRGELGRVHARAAELPLLVADSRDRPALDAIAKETSVLCTTVGPYMTYGKEVVASCAEQGTDYCDLTGEVHFMRHTIDAHEEHAEETGARIVHPCGFDSIPSDLGTLMVQEAAIERFGKPCRQVKVFAGESKGGPSGGTLATAFHLADLLQEDPSIRRILGNPYALDPDPKWGGPDGSDQKGVVFDEDLGMWTAPFVMASINSRVVRRTHALLGRPWGEGFRYSEVMSTGRGPKGLARAVGVTAGIGAFGAALALPPTRRLLQRRLPQPGEGPDRETREGGYFVMRVIGLGADADGKRFLLRGEVRGEKDPGYGGTAIMLGESALALALDREELGGPGGCFTPGAALGMHLVGRLRDAGMIFRVRS